MIDDMAIISQTVRAIWLEILKKKEIQIKSWIFISLGYGYQYPGQKNANQYPQGVPLGEDKFKYDPVRMNEKLIYIQK